MLDFLVAVLESSLFLSYVMFDNIWPDSNTLHNVFLLFFVVLLTLRFCFRLVGCTQLYLI